MKVVITSGYYNPLHVGHIEYLEAAKDLGDIHIAIINTDEQVKIKGSVPFMAERDREIIVGALRCVDLTFLSVDQDGTQCQSIQELVRREQAQHGPQTEFIFAKGGDRTLDNIPEADICNRLGVKMVFEVGGGKIQSSSTLIAEAANRRKLPS